MAEHATEMPRPLILLDNAPRNLRMKEERTGWRFGQLRTPLNGNRHVPGVPYGVDNGSFSRFDEHRWRRLLEEVDRDRDDLLFVALPDVVGDALRTLELWEWWAREVPDGLPLALVIQDGIEHVRIPWDRLAAVFIGGTTAFKYSPQAVAAARAARMMGKWVHVGRVNTPGRLRVWRDLADSVDGSGISRYDHMLRALVAEMKTRQGWLELAKCDGGGDEHAD